MSTATAKPSSVSRIKPLPTSKCTIMNAHQIKKITSSLLGKAWSAARAEQSGRKVIFCLHSVNPSARHSTIHPDAFDRILGWLTRHTDLMDLETLLDADRSGNKRPAVALTFDDGHKDNLTHALPIALNHGTTFTVFITVGLLERDIRTRSRFTALLRLKTEDFEALSWDDAGLLIDSGCTIGSHTWDHPMLSHLSDQGIEFQLLKSKELIVRNLGLSKIGMCYPYGKYGRNVDQRVIQATERAGYTYGLCVEHRGIARDENRFAVPRFIITNGDIESLSRKVSGKEDFHGAVSRNLPCFLARRLSPADFHEPQEALEPLCAFSNDDLNS